MKLPLTVRNRMFLDNPVLAKAPLRQRLSAMMREALKAVLPDRAVFLIRKAKVAGQRRGLVQVPSVPQFLDVLHDGAFQQSLREIKYITKYDTARLAHIWQLCRLSEPRGNIVEVGAWRGGSAIHLMNCQPAARFVIADTFHTSDYDEVIARLKQKGGGRDLTVLKGVFPDSDADGAVRDVTFAHIDVVIYESCRRALEYVARRCRKSAIIVVNDVLRYPWGVSEALCEFSEAHPDWIVVPLYPGAAVVLRRDGDYPLARLVHAPEVGERIARHRSPTFGTKAEPLGYFRDRRRPRPRKKPRRAFA
jgi:hypothetical protein